MSFWSALSTRVLLLCGLWTWSGNPPLFFRLVSPQMRTSFSPTPWMTSSPQLQLQKPQNPLKQPLITLKQQRSFWSTSTASLLQIKTPQQSRRRRTARGGRPSSSQALVSTTRSPGICATASPLHTHTVHFYMLRVCLSVFTLHSAGIWATGSYPWKARKADLL